MKLKEIESLPCAKINKKGNMIKMIEGIQGLLILDLFVDKTRIGRYVVDIKTGEHHFFDTKWRTRRLWGILNGSIYDCYYTSLRKSWKWYIPDEERTAADACMANSNVLNHIDDLEADYNYKKARAAYGRKEERVEKLMDQIDKNGMFSEDWWLRTCADVKDKEYMFYDKYKDMYGCTACGKEHTIKNGRHKQKYICTRTGKNTTLIKRQKQLSVKDYAILLQNIDSKQVVERLVEVDTIYRYCRKDIYAEDTIRAVLSKTGKKTKIYYNQEFRDYYGYAHSRREVEWWDTNPAQKRWKSAYMYPVEKDVLNGTECECLRIDQIAAGGIKMNYNGMLMNPSSARILEYLVKMRLTKLAQEESERLTYWGNEMRDLNMNGSSASEILGIDMQKINRLRQNNGGRKMLAWLKVEQITGKKVSDEALKRADEARIEPDYYMFIFDRMTPEKLINYVSKLKGPAGRYKNSDYILASDWKDYLAMAKRLGMNTMEPIVYSPKDLEKRHNELVDEIRRRGDDEWICEIADKYPHIESICQNAKEKYEYHDDEYMLIVPESIKDIVDDGRQLHHCAASSERYFDRINKRECYLVFVRRKEEPDKAWYTVEIQPGGTIRQKRTEFNRQDDEDKVMAFLKKWQKEIKKRLTQEDIALEQQSCIQREIEQMELIQKGDEKSMRVWQELENDFLKNKTEDIDKMAI